MLITKVKILNENVHIEFENGSTKYTVDCKQQPKPEFTLALAALKIDFHEICEFAKGELKKIDVTGASFRYTGDNNDTMGAVITGKRALTNSNVPLVINTPFKSEDNNTGKQPKKALLTVGCVERLATLMEEAKKYIKGSRAQQDLFKGKD